MASAGKPQKKRGRKGPPPEPLGDPAQEEVMRRKAALDSELEATLNRGIDEEAPLVAQRLAAREQRNLEPYDGVLGVPPPWVPKWHRDEFENARNKLLEHTWRAPPSRPAAPATPAEVRAWLDAYLELSQPHEDAYRPGFFPMEFRAEIARLAHIWHAFSLGPIDGLAALGDEGGAMAAQRRRAGGEKTAADRKDKGVQTLRIVIAEWHRLASHPKRERAGIIATKAKYTPDHVRYLIKKSGLR